MVWKSPKMAKTTTSKTTPAPIIKKIISEKSPPPYLLVLSPDRIRIKRVVDLIANTFLLKKDSHWVGDCIQLNLKSSTNDLKSFIFKANEVSLFSYRKTIILEDIEEIYKRQKKDGKDALSEESKSQNSDKVSLILNLLETASNKNLIIITGQNLRSDSKIYKFFKSKNLLIHLEQFSNEELYRWILKELENYQLKIEDKALESLIIRCENSADQASKYLEILDIYSEDRNITLSNLSEIFPSFYSEDDFEWINFITNKKPYQAELRLNTLLKEKENVFKLMGLLHSNYLKYYTISSMLENNSSANEISSKLGINSWLLNKYLPVAKKYSPLQLKVKLAEILKADSLLKFQSLGYNEIYSNLTQKLAKND